MTQISIDTIKSRHDELTEKVKQATPSKEVIQEVRAFIIEVRAAGAVTPPGNKRELLRSLADVWGNYVYRESGVFPPTDLDIYAGPESQRLALPPWLASLSRPVQILLLVGVILVLIVLTSGVSSWIASRRAEANRIAEMNAQATQIAYEIEQTVLAQIPLEGTSETETPTEILSPTETPTLTPSPTATPTPTFELIGSLAPNDSLGRLVELTSLKGGEFVSPEMTLSGVYRNLPPGYSWSIHIVLEPLSNVGMLYPLEPYYVVPEGETGGNWDLNIEFDIGTGFGVEERFLISLVAAQDDSIRNALKAAVGRGLNELPPKTFSYLGVTTVTRKAYTLFHEERLIYASYLSETNNSEILVARLDGSDTQLIPNRNKAVGLQPSISPNGEKIVYVGQERSGNDILYLLWIMESNGENRKEIKRQAGTIDRPLWSPSGRYIAYSAIGPLFSQSETPASIFNIFVYDTESGTHYQLTTNVTSDRYPAWINETTLVYNARTPETKTMGLVFLDMGTGETKTRLDQITLDEEQPAVSSDGNLIAYSASASWDPEDGADIYLYDIRNDKITQLTGLRGDDGHDLWPTWSLDGQTIYFQSHRTGQGGTSPNIWAVDIDGSNLRQITFGLISDMSPFVGTLNAFWLIE